MAKRVIFIHGRAQKPSKQVLQKLWYEATKAGLKRDYGKSGLEAFARAKKEFVYYGDLSNKFLNMPEENPESRMKALKVLSSFQKNEFNRKKYLELSNGGGLSDDMARIFSTILGSVGIADYLITKVAPDIGEYWNGESYFGSDVRARMTNVLKNALKSGDQIMIVAHSLGSMITYDNLWKFSHYGEYRHDFGSCKKVDTFISLGSPLGDENVKEHLKGSKSKGFKRYPINLNRWINFAAVDDFISHDCKLKNDYKVMSSLGLLSEPVIDKKVYNLNVRNEEANPHSSIGYLVHPEFSRCMFEWLI